MLRILLILVPSTLIVILFFVFYSKNEAKPAFCFEPIPDENVAIDVKAVNSAIDSMGHEELWGIRPVEDSVERKLTAAQGALFRRYWEMETIQNEKPGAPEQLDLELFGEALDELVRMDELEARVKFDVDGFEEWAKRKEQMGGGGDLCAQKVVMKGYSEGENGPIGIAKLALTKMMDGNLEVKKVKIEEKIEYEGIGVGRRRKRSINFEKEKGKILALKKYLMENLMKTADGKNRKRDEKLAYIWYAELEYWLAKQFERRGIEHPDEQIEGIIGVDEEVDFLAKEWAKSTEKLAKLRIWIGKEYRRRK